MSSSINTIISNPSPVYNFQTNAKNARHSYIIQNETRVAVQIGALEQRSIYANEKQILFAFACRTPRHSFLLADFIQFQWIRIERNDW